MPAEASPLNPDDPSVRSTDFYDLVSGRRRGPGPSALRLMLAAAEGPYRAGVWWRNRRYDRVDALSHAATIPVVSVGNLTLGGTGKTPMVKWVARFLRAQGVRVALASRGYGAEDGGPNDEALELEQALPDVPHLVGPDRVESARIAAEELAAQALVLDDGFQHRRLRRDLDLVLLDATEPFGFGRVFPRGALREPVASLRRAQVVCLTRSDLIDEANRDAIRKRVARVAPSATWCEAVTRPTRLIGVDESNAGTLEEPLASLAGQRIVAFCGIGNPAAFQATLGGAAAETVELIEFADHHRYTREDIDRLGEVASKANADALVCTQKDLVKVGVGSIAGHPVRAIAIEAELTVGQEALEERLREIAQHARQHDDIGETQGSVR